MLPDLAGREEREWRGGEDKGVEGEEKGGGWKGRRTEGCRREGRRQEGKDGGRKKGRGNAYEPALIKLFLQLLTVGGQEQFGGNPIKIYFCWYDRILTVKVLLNMKHTQRVCTQDSQF